MIWHLYIGPETGIPNNSGKWFGSNSVAETKLLLLSNGMPASIVISDALEGSYQGALDQLVEITSIDMKIDAPEQKLSASVGITVESSDQDFCKLVGIFIEDYFRYRLQDRIGKNGKWNLFLDDERWPPRDGQKWKVARCWEDVEELIQKHGMPSFISFDHDLKTGQPTGADIARNLVELDQEGRHPKHLLPPDFDLYVHSRNPVGAQNIQSYLLNYLKFKQDQINTLNL